MGGFQLAVLGSTVVLNPVGIGMGTAAVAVGGAKLVGKLRNNKKQHELLVSR